MLRWAAAALAMGLAGCANGNGGGYSYPASAPAPAYYPPPLIMQPYRPPPVPDYRAIMGTGSNTMGASSHTYSLPSGRMVNCNTIGSYTNCY